MKAILLERNPLVRKHIERFMLCAGCKVVGLDKPEEVESQLDKTLLLAADIFDIDVVMRAAEAVPDLKILLWTAEPIERTLRLIGQKPRFSNILARPNFDSPPRDWELMMVLRRLQHPTEPGPKFAWFLDWGFSGFQENVDTSSKRDRLVSKVQSFALKMGARQKIAELFNEVAHEMLMNAMYDAPVDKSGAHLYVHDRKADLRLPPEQQPTLKIASDGSKLALQVTDPFGGLTRDKVFQGIERGLAGGELDTSNGGAGLGLTVIHRGTAALFIDVEPGRRTEATGLFELDTSHRDFRIQPKSLHYFSRS